MIANIQEVVYRKLCYQHSDQPPWKIPVNFLFDVINYAHDLCAASLRPEAAGAGSGHKVFWKF